MKNKKQLARIILKAAEKARYQILTSRTKAYFKPLKHKEWYMLAVEYTVQLTQVMEKFLNKQKKEYAEFFSKQEKLYIKSQIQKAYRTEEYLDERYNHVVVEDVKDKLIDLGQEFLKEVQKILEDMLKQGLIKEAAEAVMSSFKMDFDFNEFDKRSRDQLRDKVILWANQVQNTTEQTIKSILVDGFEQGLSSYDIAKMIKKHTDFGFARAENIARTEVISSCNYADLKAWEMNSDIIGKEWDDSGDRRTRPTHRVAAGQKRKLNEPFIVGGSKLMHPGDGSLGAAAKEVCKCRCTMNSVFKDESMQSNTIYDDKDVGSSDWLRRQDKDFRETYLGGKIKRQLFDAHLLKEEDFAKKYKDIDKTGIILIDNDCIQHSTKGRKKDYSKYIDPKNPLRGGGKMLKGGHSEENIIELDKRRKWVEDEYKDLLEGKGSKSKMKLANELLKNYTYNYKTYSNGVRVGNVLGHSIKAKREQNGQSWFPKDWNGDKIRVAAMYVANLKDQNKIWYSNDGVFKHAIFENVEVIVCKDPNTNKITTTFPNNIQKHLERKGEVLYD